LGLAPLEDHLQRQLHNTRPARAADQTEVPRGGVAIRVAELSVVEGVEELPAELHSYILRGCEILLDAHIPVVNTRSVERIAAGVAEEALGGNREAACVQELRVHARIHAASRAVAGAVRPVSHQWAAGRIRRADDK